MCVPRQRQSLLQFHFEPDLPNVSPALFPLEEAIVKHGLSFLELSRLGQIQNQFVGQRSWQMIEVRISLQRSYPFLRGLLQNAERLIDPAVEFKIARVRAQALLKDIECFLRL